METIESIVTKEEKIKKSLWDGLWSKNRLKKGKVTAVLFLTENGVAKPLEVECKKGFFEINGQSYHEDKDCIYRLSSSGTPLAIIEEKSLLPIGTNRWYEHRKDETDLNFMKRKMMECQDHLLRGIRYAEFVRMGEKDKSPIDTKTIVIIGIVLVIGYALLKGSGKI